MLRSLRAISIFTSLIVFACPIVAQDMPHEDVDFECEVCHSMTEWEGVQFDHVTNTGFTLEGRHAFSECKGCHDLKDFSVGGTNCVSCHKDIHEGKLGPDCTKCHTPDGFQIFNVEDIHAETNFPLMGRHALADCQSCHNGLPIGDLSFKTTRCVGCHQQQYLEVTSPNHVTAGFTTECDECHQMSSWRPALLADHDMFFPINSGEHAGEWDDCATCHVDPDNFQNFSCFDCHEHNRAEADEDHAGISGYSYNSQDCYLCHPTGEAGSFGDHDVLYFPIFSGPHDGEWSSCSACHDNPTDRTQFNCLACHTLTAVNNLHQSINGYSAVSEACVACHPAGERIEFTEHDAAYFPIYSGTHDAVWAECFDCHTDPTNRSVFSCLTCHEQTETDGIHGGMTAYSYESSACFTCHPTGSGGEFPEHDALFFPIYVGTHSDEWADCSDCHTDPTDRSVYSCVVCHTQSTTNSIHGGITSYVWESSACLTCHPTGEGGEFTAHDAAYFPIYSGTHDGTWDDCITCHTNPDDRTEFTCEVCHTAGVTDPIHTGITSYTYDSDACLTCHPTGASGEYTEHDAAYFPIYSGTHDGEWDDCIICHTNPADRSEFTCLVCHDQSTTDPIHQGITTYSYVSTACLTCHPQGDEAVYTEHDAAYFPIYSGTHNGNWSECADCHTDPADRSIYDCLGCHTQAPTDIVHMSMPEYSYVSTVCFGCHATGEIPDYPEHDANFFPIYSGAHNGAWADCATCHTDPADRAVFTCLVCHVQVDMDNMHTGITGYVYNSTDCNSCHPDGAAIEFTEHDASYFPIYSGTHNGLWAECATCHTVVGDRTQFDCLSCHVQATVDQVHMGMISYSYSSPVCYTCHPTGVVEDYTEHDGAFFPIYSGTHVGSWADCATCHTDPADRAVFTCLVCHDQPTIDPVHLGMTSYSYVSSVCLTCHPVGNIEDYTEHDGDFFPIYSGAHNGTWVDCSTCHTDPADKSIFTCLVCHVQVDMDNMHVSIPGYVYNSDDCLTCHPDGSAIEFTAHDALYFPIYTGLHDGTWAECATCHTVPGDRTQFDCLSCHEQTATDVVHMGMPEYSYASDACYTCHPQGVPQDYPEHDANFFPIYSGNHNGVWATCATCHTDPADRAVFTCLVCHDQPTIDPVHLGMTSYLYESATCLTCHPVGNIEDYLEHDGDFFPIYSGVHDGRWGSCATCHTDPTSKAVYWCTQNCHARMQTDNRHNSPPPGVAGYDYDEHLCYSCHPNGVVEP